LGISPHWNDAIAQAQNWVDRDPKVRPPEYNYRSKAENEAHSSPNNLLDDMSMA